MSAARFADRLGGRLHAMINEEREKRDIPPLHGRDPLIRAAEQHSIEMAMQGEIFHEGRDGSPRSRSPRGYRGIAENVGAIQEHSLLGEVAIHERWSTDGAARRLVDGWLDSPGHREQMLNSRNRYDGVGVWVEGDSLYATHLMARLESPWVKLGRCWESTPRLARQLRSLARRATLLPARAASRWPDPTHDERVRGRPLETGAGPAPRRSGGRRLVELNEPLEA